MADWKTISRSCDEEFWPTLETARQAYQAALTIKNVCAGALSGRDHAQESLTPAKFMLTGLFKESRF
jgi:hypothetical protein